jgi:hypothetical protein
MALLVPPPPSPLHCMQPLGLSSILILSIDLGTEVAPAISLAKEEHVRAASHGRTWALCVHPVVAHPPPPTPTS